MKAAGSIFMQTVCCLTGLLLLPAMMLAGCHVESGGGTVVTQGPPAGLTERDESVVYAEGQEIIPNTPVATGGEITQYSVSPPLPDGLILDPPTGVITGTPTTVSNATEYTVTGTNAEGSTTALVEIEVKPTAVAPDSLNYPVDSVIDVANEAITPDTPIATGGEITQYSVSPELPEGLVLDSQTGIISGTPTAVTAPAVYTVTGSNSVDSVQAQLDIEVQAQVEPPAGLSYSDPVPVYTVGRPIPYNEPLTSGGEITQFSVSPSLPDGLSMNALTGVISGTPTTAQAQTTFIVTASNSAGSVTAQIALIAAAGVVGEWLPADAMDVGRFRHTATLLPDGRVLVAAGYGKRALSSAELYDPASDTWSQTGSLVQQRYLHTATLLTDGKVLVAGGSNNGGGTAQASAELYDPTTATWSQTGSMRQARDSHTATLLPNGKVLVAGGEGKTGFLTSAELYDPTTGTWSQTGSLNQARDTHTATLLTDGKVLVAGGSGNSGSGSYLSSSELYDPAAGTWFQTSSMSQARTIYAATLLADGKVLAAGGFNGTALSTTELYDPATGTWSQTGGMSQARYYLTVTLLPNGKVLVAGGEDDTAVLASAELYDPATGTWSPTGSLIQPRTRNTATLLPDGSVLAAGSGSKGTYASAELFH